MRSGKCKKSNGDPGPTALDKDGVEEVIFPCEVRRREGWVLEVSRVGGRGASLGGNEGKEGAEEEEDGEDC